MTPKPHPKVITIQPEFWALDLLRSTAATTPSPSKIRRHVPIVSAPMMLKSFSLLDRTWGRRRHYPRAFDNVKPSSPNQNPVRQRALGAAEHPVDRACRGDPAAAVGPHATARSGGHRGRARIAEGHRPRAAAHAAPRRLRRAGL